MPVPLHHRRRRGTAVLALVLALSLAGCGSSDEGATGDVAVGDAAETSTEPPARSLITADTDGAAPTTASTESVATTEAEIDGSTISSASTTETPAGVSTRLAPARDGRGIVLAFDRSTVTPMLHSGPGEPIDLAVDGELINVIAIPSGGFAFQTTDDRTIWLWSGVTADPEPLVVVAENERLDLEGAGVDEGGEAVVFYQRWFYGEPETTGAVLVSHRMSDDTVIEIAATGGWESGARFPTLSSLGVDNGDTAVASWGAEGFNWLETIDVRTGDIVFDSRELTGECFDGDGGCPWFDVAVPFAGDIVGLGPVWNEDQGWIDAFGLWIYDTSTGDLELMQSWPWDNGTWYAEDMFLDGSTLVLSLQDEPYQGAPLPPLYFDLVSGESWTLPESVFLRPAYLS